jgi:glucose/arabinose dehydrogenase
MLALLTPSCQAAPKPEPSVDGRPPANCRYVDEGFGATGTTPIRVEKVATGLVVPWSLAFLPDRESILVTEREGRVRLIRKGALVPKPVAILEVDQIDEAGLLGMALHPAFPKEPWVYFYSTHRKAGKPVNRVSRYRLAPDGATAQLDRVILDGIPAAKYHSGGRLRFGPDGMLYVGTGDAREPELSQKLESLAGKLLRITPDGQPAPGNPWPGSPVYLLGIRNTQGFDWPDPRDPKTIALADHGPSGELRRRGGDEISIARRAQNLGWPRIWGCEAGTEMVTPVISWKTAAPPGGIALYTGDSIPDWKGSLIIGTLGSKHLQRIVLDTSTPDRSSLKHHEVYLLGDAPSGHGRLRDVAMGTDQQLYVTTSNCDDRGTCPNEKDMVLRIKPR